MNIEDFKQLTVDNVKTGALIIPPSSSISKIIGILNNCKAYEVLVEGSSGRIGMVSMRDLLYVRDIISMKTSSLIKYVPKLSLKSRISEAALFMAQYRIRALPIVEGNEIIGEVTALSIVEAMRKNMVDHIKVSSIMTPNPIVVDECDLVTMARRLMMGRKIDHLPILKDNKLTGILTSSRIVSAMLPSSSRKKGELGSEMEIRFDFPVSQLREGPAVTCQIDTYIGEVIDEMINHLSTYCIVTFWDEIQGITTYRDVMKVVVQEEKVDDVPIYLVGLPEDPFEASVASDKFKRAVNMLRKSIPEILEARSVIKCKSSSPERRRYEVQVSLNTPYKTFSYSASGWDLPSIYDEISNKLKSLNVRHKRGKPESLRYNRENIPI